MSLCQKSRREFRRNGSLREKVLETGPPEQHKPNTPADQAHSLSYRVFCTFHGVLMKLQAGCRVNLHIDLNLAVSSFQGVSTN